MPSKCEIAPIKNASPVQKPWEGNCHKKPWEYPITAVIPCLNTSETLPLCVELLRLQTTPPYILVIDTGSSEEHLAQVEALRSDDLEVLALRLNGVQHPSDFVSMAMDCAFTMCRTEFLFATHADCFLRRRDFLEELMEKCKVSPVVGYEISPRAHADWHGMLSHTASMYHMPTMDRIGFGWSLRRLCNLFNLTDHKPNPLRPGWPDTEILGNYILRHHKIKPLLIGSEQNFSRQVDDNIDHFRSYTSAKLYSPQFFAQASTWFALAKKEALERIEEWKRTSA
jgi:glycosyltransferase involved in cell wall biosynthesis